MITIIWSLLASRLGGWIVGGVAVLAVLGLLKWQNNAKLKAQAQRDAAQMAAKIGQEAFIELYEDREKIKTKASKLRGKLNEWEKHGDLDSLSADFNNPGGVRRALPLNRSSGSGGPQKAPARYSDPADPKTQYQEAPGR